MALKTIKFDNAFWRIGLLLAALICVTAAYFVVKWSFANAIAAQGANKQLVERMTEWSPSDPQTHYALAVLNQRTFSPDDFEKSIIEYEKATALSPNDYRLWVELGKARERNGDSIEAEKALRKASELAPNYAAVQWTLGNILLRQGKTEEAFVEIRKAVEGDAKYAAPTVSTAWQIFDGDAAQVKRNLGNSVQTNAALALFLAGQKDYDNALAMWNSLPDDEKKTTFKQIGEQIFHQMIAAKKYRAALQIQKQISEPGAEDFAVGKIFNGGFEINEKTAVKSPFDWQYGESGGQPQIGVDNQQKHGGNLSLVLVYNATDGKLSRTAFQLIAVEAGKRYVFETFYKSNLGKTAVTFKWEIVNPEDEKVIAATDAILPNAEAWTSLKAEFIVPENTEAVVIRLARDACKLTPCPVSGRIWFDDFSLNG